MAHLHAFFDESGKSGDHPIVSFCGFVDSVECWRLLQEDWNGLLLEYELKEIHGSKALRYSEPCGNLKRGTAEARSDCISPFIDVITNCINFAIVVAVDVVAFNSSHQLLRNAYPDPHYFAFSQAVTLMLHHFEIPKPLAIALVCDDDQNKAIRCYKLLSKLKLVNAEARERIPSICFSDSARYPQLQAADLLSHLVRLEAQQRFAAKPYRYEGLFEALKKVHPENGNHTHFSGGFYGGAELEEFVTSRLR